MIKEIRETQPFIHFGFNRQEINVYPNEVITIFQDNIYNENFYTAPVLVGDAFTQVEKGNFNFTSIKYTTEGTKKIKFTFEDNNNFSFESNELTINVIGITYGSTTIFWGNETITFND